VDAASVDYHVTLAQGIAQSCLTHVELRDELFAQLIKLTNRRDSEISDDDLSYLQVHCNVAVCCNYVKVKGVGGEVQGGQGLPWILKFYIFLLTFQ